MMRCPFFFICIILPMSNGMTPHFETLFYIQPSARRISINADLYEEKTESNNRRNFYSSKTPSRFRSPLLPSNNG